MSKPARTFLLCAALLVLYAFVAAWAVAGKSLTNDEPYSLGSAIVMQRMGDYRVDPEDPPLWKRVVGLATADLPAKIDTYAPEWADMLQSVLAGRIWTARMLYRTPEIDIDAYVHRGRFVMMAIALACGAMLAAAAYRYAGPIAAVVATLAFVACPAVIAHGPLFRADMSITAVTVLLAIALARLLERGSLVRVAAVGAIVGIGLLIKLSASLFPFMILLALIVRALINAPWLWRPVRNRAAGDRVINGRLGRLLVAAGSLVAMGIIAYGVLWAGYGFRFAASPAPNASLHFERYLTIYFHYQRMAMYPNAPRATMAEYLAWKPPLTIVGARFAYEHHLLPEGWLTGMVWILATSFAWPHYYLGRVLTGGNVGYYPFTLLVKSPMAWVIGLIASAAVLIVRRVKPARAGGAWHKSFREGASERPARSGRPLACAFADELQTVYAPPAGGANASADEASAPRPSTMPMTIASLSVVIVYGGTLLNTNLNEGVRHMLPLFPFIALMMGAAAAAVWAKPAGGRWAVVGLLAVLVLESALAFPNDIAYFNLAAGGSTGGVKLLGDSDLDWGQDVPLLAAWQKQHPNVLLYYVHSGASDPSHYGINYVNLPGGYALGPPAEQVTRPGVIALDATIVQGISASPDFDPIKLYAPIKALPLIDVLGGTIYLYQWDGQ